MMNEQETKRIYETLKNITSQLEMLTKQLEETIKIDKETGLNTELLEHIKKIQSKLPAYQPRMGRNIDNILLSKLGNEAVLNKERFVSDENLERIKKEYEGFFGEKLQEKTCSKGELLETLTTPNEFRLMNGRNIDFDNWINNLNEKQVAKLEGLCDSFGEENIDTETELPKELLCSIKNLMSVLEKRKERLPKPIVRLLQEKI